MKIYQEVKKFKGRPFRYFISVLPPDHVMHVQLQVAVDRRLTAAGTRWMVRIGTRYADPDLRLVHPEGDSREFGEQMSYDLDTALAIATLLAPKLSLRAMNGRTAADLANDDVVADSRRKVDEWRWSTQHPFPAAPPPPLPTHSPSPAPWTKWRKGQWRGRPPKATWHGTQTMYGRGCRCADCRRAQHEYSRKRFLANNPGYRDRNPAPAWAVPIMDQILASEEATSILYHRQPLKTVSLKKRYQLAPRLRSHHHGTNTGFVYGCRCLPCREAASEYDCELRIRKILGLPKERVRKYRVDLVRKGRKLKSHGTVACYGRGCRCPRCRQALDDYYALWRQNRRRTDKPEIYTLGLPTRVANALWREGIRTFRDLLLTDLRDLRDIRNIGDTSLQQLEALADEAEDQLFFTTVSLSGVIA